MTFDRRMFLLGAAALPFGTSSLAANDAFATIERRIGARLGIAAVDTGSGKRLAYRAGERFPMCSTFKLLAVGAVLARVDRGRENLDRRIMYGEADLLNNAPVTRAHVGEGGMTLDALCAAAIEWSDNTAANLILATLDGPAGATRFVRALGDNITRLDRTEPTANTAIPGDPRDTTTPAAMLADLQRLTLGNALSETSRARLTTWLTNYKTRFPRLAAGLPAAWRSAHKMGTGDNGSTNDVAILWPPGRAPILVAAYCTGSAAPQPAIDAALAYAGRTVANSFS